VALSGERSKEWEQLGNSREGSLIDLCILIYTFIHKIDLFSSENNINNKQTNEGKRERKKKLRCGYLRTCRKGGKSPVDSLACFLHSDSQKSCKL